MRRAALLLAVAGALLAPATPAFAHGGNTVDGTAYQIRITGISTPERGLTVRTVEAGALLELTNRTGHSVEILGYSGEPYLDTRADGTYQNVNSPAAYLDAPATADPTAPPSWQRLSTATTVRWHDERVYPAPGRRQQNWAVPLRVQTRTFEIRGTTTWEPPPNTWLWWSGAGLLALALTTLASRWPRTITPVTLIAGLAPISYATSRAVDGGTAPLVLICAGALAIAAAWRHPPFFLTLSGAALAAFGGLSSTAVFREAVVPAAGPGWLSRTSVLIALSAGTSLTLTGLHHLRATLPAATPPTPMPSPDPPARPSATSAEPPTASAEAATQPPAASADPTAQPSTASADPPAQPPTASADPPAQPPAASADPPAQPPAASAEAAAQLSATSAEPTARPATTPAEPTTQPAVAPAEPTNRPAVVSEPAAATQ